MLQRSPTYIISRPDKDKMANFLRKVLPEKWAYAITRRKNMAIQQLLYRRTRTAPEQVKKLLLNVVRKKLGSDYDVEKHFTPHYNPWDQRLCLIPNGDLFKAISSEKASVVTEHIDTFTKKGVLLKSGQELEADIIITATGLSLVVPGNGSAEFMVDGQAVDFSKTYTYKGLMYSGIPNLASTFGYINASWTLRSDLIAEYVCRLINHMDETGTNPCTPRLRDNDKEMPTRGFIDNFSSNFIQRATHLFPMQGDHEPWLSPHNYSHDKKVLRHGKIEDGALIFSSLNKEATSA